MYGCESWTIKKAEHQRNYVFKLSCWRRLLRVPWSARRSNQFILKEISPKHSLEGLMLKLKLQYFGHMMRRAETHLKRPWCWERLRAGGEGDDRGWDGWMASPTRWTWVWVNSVPTNSAVGFPFSPHPLQHSLFVDFFWCLALLCLNRK